jgi:hypothetical protein
MAAQCCNGRLRRGHRSLRFRPCLARMAVSARAHLGSRRRVFKVEPDLLEAPPKRAAAKAPRARPALAPIGRAHDSPQTGPSPVGFLNSASERVNFFGSI